MFGQQDPRIPGNSNLYLSEMENPWTLKGKQLLLSIPEYPWEQIGFMVNEDQPCLSEMVRFYHLFWQCYR